MKLKLTSLLLLAASQIASGAIVTIGSSTFSNLLDDSGNLLPVGSKIQIGFFSGRTVVKDAMGLQTNGASTFGEAEWNTFQPFDSTLFGITNEAPGFEAVFGVGYTIDTDLIPNLAFPAYVGFRIFDTTSNDVSSAMFNTVARTVSTWEFNDPSVVTNQPPSPNIPQRFDITPGTIFWQDSANPFETSISPIPEPSSTMTLLLGAGLLLGSRRRK